MTDPRYTELAENLVSYSIEVKRNQNILIDAFDVPDAIVVELIRAIRKRNANPYVNVHQARVSREMLRGATEAQYKSIARVEMAQMKEMDGYIALRGAHNIFESSDVPSKRMQLAMKHLRPVMKHRVDKTNWVVLRWPTPAMAQQSLTSTESFEDFYFRVCTMDYKRMLVGQRALKRLMDRTDQVYIKGPGTELTFSIKGIRAVMCAGNRNVPDGETFTAPVRNSVEGVLSYNAPTVYQGTSFDGVRLEFEKGKIVKASCSGKSKKLNEILNSDEGARYIGEFAIGFNPHIKEPMRDILFDEKISGSFHFTPGQAYEGVADNGNQSQIHWDMVCIQRKDYGGGEIWFDGKLVRKDGLFVPKSLQKLNPDYLLGKSKS